MHPVELQFVRSCLGRPTGAYRKGHLNKHQN